MILPQPGMRRVSMRRTLMTIVLLSTTTAFGAPMALAQTVQTPQPAQQQVTPTHNEQAARQCLEDLDAFRMRARQDGYWLGGWGARWGAGVGAEAAPPGAEGITPGVGAPAQVAPQIGPWGETTMDPWVTAGPPATGMMSPRYQIRLLFGAANVLGQRGDEVACQATLASLQNVYAELIQTLDEAGLRPDQITTWRQEQILMAERVTEVPWTISSEQIVGLEVRNAHDEYLGDIDDVVFDRQTGELAFAILARGGFLGIGTDYVAIPWEVLQVPPGMNLLVLNVPEAVVENAPAIDPDRFANPVVYEQYSEVVEEYWRQHAPG
jgi:sporulation protein YlmC with PRC-barrel domain